MRKSLKLFSLLAIGVIFSILSSFIFIPSRSDNCPAFICEQYGSRDGLRGVPIPWQTVLSDSPLKGTEVTVDNPVLFALNTGVYAIVLVFIFKKWIKK